MRADAITIPICAAVTSMMFSCQPDVAKPPPRRGAVRADHESTVVPSKPTLIEIQAPSGGASGHPVGRYEKVFLDPVLEEMRKNGMKRDDAEQDATGKIKASQKEKKEKERTETLVLRATLPEAERPVSLDAFEKVWHLPPTAQYFTGTCWSFAMTSFMESEVMRRTGKKVKLSEMATVYFEYLAKAGRWAAERGDSVFSEGSEGNGLTRIYGVHGAWPAAAYTGVTADDGRHDHQLLLKEMQAVLDACEKNDMWDEATILSLLGVVLDREMGEPPGSFEHEGVTYTPGAFMKDVLTIDPAEYVDVMSTVKIPFWTKGELEVPDNWWHDASYHNVPLDDFVAAMKGALVAGYSLVIAVDVSEPGKDAENDVMFIPPWDIPAEDIDQMAREYRMAEHVTTDDHGVHVVGFTTHAGHDWFLVKDSGRSARHGKHEGYYFVQDDYVRLKVLAFTVHRDAVKDLIARFPAP